VGDEGGLGVLLAEFFEEGADDEAGGVSVEGVEGFAGPGFEASEFANDAVGFFLEGGGAGFEFGAGSFRQLLEDVRRDGLAVVAAGDGDEAAGGEGDEEALCGGGGLQCFDDGFALSHDALQGVAAALVVGVVVEDGGEFVAEGFDEAGEAAFEVVAGGGGEGDGARAVGVVEVVEVAPVGDGGVRFGGFVDEDADGGFASGGGLAGDGEVEALGLDAEAEADRFKGAVLAGDALQGLDGGGGGGDEVRRVLGAQLVGLEGQVVGGCGADAGAPLSYGSGSVVVLEGEYIGRGAQVAGV